MHRTTAFSLSAFHTSPVVGILRNHTPEDCLRIAAAYATTGFTTLEVTMNTPGVAEIITELTQTFPTMNIGAGTVCSVAELQTVRAAGASFIVTPILHQEVVQLCVDEGIPVFPGAYTPTEIYQAWSWGATAVKVFPASQLGVRYIKDLQGPLPQIKLVPTGGVSLANISSFFSAGVYGVGMGSSLFPKELIRQGDFAGLQQHLAEVKQAISSFSS